MREATEPAPVLSPPSDASVLVVEDEVLQRMTLAGEMRRAGYTVFEAASADEGVAILQTGTPVDLIITDIDMPGAMDGLALAAFVRRHYSAIYVVVASGQVAGLSRANNPVDAIFSKPYELSAIATTVRRLIGGQQSAAMQVDPNERDR